MSSDVPRVSVVVTAYNAAVFLQRTLDSVREQTIGCWECVVVDDGSTDDTPVVARECAALDGRIRLVQKPNGGVSSARNAGFAAIHPASGFVIFMDGDDTFRPDALELLVAELDAHPDAAGAHGLAQFMDENDVLSHDEGFERLGRERRFFDGRRIRPTPPGAPTSFAVMIVGYWLYPPGLAMIRRSVVDALRADGPFDETLGKRGINGEDWEFFASVTRHGDIRFVDRVILNYRRHSTSSTTSGATNAAGAINARNRIITSRHNTPEQKRLLRQLYRPLQSYKMSEKLYFARQFAGQKRYGDSLKMFVHVGGLFVRYARGFPTRKG